MICCLAFLCITTQSFGQADKKQTATKESAKDTSKAKKDSLASKNKKDSLSLHTSPSALPSEVKYKAKDSVVFDLENKKVYMFGKQGKEPKAHVDYTDVKLDAAYIQIDYTKNVIFAKPLPDSAGKMVGKPVFAQGKDITHSDSMAYNFKSKKGKIYNLFTSEGEGYIHIGEAKTLKDTVNKKDVVFASHGKYTTCNLPEDPHFYIESNKMKLMPNDKIVTGPAWIVVEGVPLPIILPFGFFPAHNQKSTGIILPSYGESATQGFSLKGGGFYWGGNDHYDAAIKGDIYTAGGYRLEFESRYKTLYKYSGDFDISYARNTNGVAETPSFSVTENYAVRWTHVEDVKADPGSTFNASVNAASPGFFEKNSYNPTELVNQSMSSSINYSKRFANSPFNLNISLRHDQDLGLHTINFDLPSAVLSMNRIYPFKNQNDTKKHWWDEIGITYTATLTNHLSSYDSTLKSDIVNINKFRTYLDQEIPISATFKVLKYFSLTPSINNSIYVYTKKFVTENVKTVYNPLTGTNQNVNPVDTFSGIYLAHVHSANLALGTTIYGMYKFKKGKVTAFRHVLTPTITGVFSPDYSAPQYGYYGSSVVDAFGTVRKFSYFSDAAGNISGPASGRQGSLNFSLGNTFEMKVKNPKDTVNPTKKVKILDYLNFNGGYNFLLDSDKLAPINISTATTLFNKLSISGNALFDAYHHDKTGTMTRFYDWDVEHKIGEITTAGVTAGLSLNEKAKNTGHNIQQIKNPFVYYNYPETYASFDVPWDLRINYSANYDALHPVYNTQFGTYTTTKQLTHSGTVSGNINLTKNWKVMVTSGYDFTTHELNLTKINIYRDLHCWTMSFEWIPFGTYKSYFFNIHIKASTLQDLKLEKRKEYIDYQ